MEPVPRPASLEKMPRATPFCMLVKKLPTIPPVTAMGEKAPVTMAPSTAGMRPALRTTTPSASTTYSSAMKGTSLSVTRPMRLMPPSSTSIRINAMATPMIQRHSVTASAGSRP